MYVCMYVFVHVGGQCCTYCLNSLETKPTPHTDNIIYLQTLPSQTKLEKAKYQNNLQSLDAVSLLRVNHFVYA